MIHCKVVPHQLCLMDYRPKTSSISLPQSLDILVVNQRYLQDEAFQMIAKLTHITWFMRDITIPYDTTVALNTNITGGGVIHWGTLKLVPQRWAQLQSIQHVPKVIDVGLMAVRHSVFS